MPNVTHTTRGKRRELSDTCAKRRPSFNQSFDPLAPRLSTRGSIRAALNEPVWWEKRLVCMFVFKHTATKGHRCNEGAMRILNMACCRKKWSVSRHGMQAIKIWSALDNELVTVKMKITTYELYETHDGWIHKTPYRVVDMCEIFGLDQG